MDIRSMVHALLCRRPMACAEETPASRDERAGKILDKLDERHMTTIYLAFMGYGEEILDRMERQGKKCQIIPPST